MWVRSEILIFVYLLIKIMSSGWLLGAMSRFTI